MKLLDGVKADAVLSTDGLYRYVLTRDWFPKYRGTVVWVMLNPSTADAETDDLTIRKCQGFSRRWGFDGIAVLNLFAYRTPYPSDLKDAREAGIDIIGPENDAIIRDFAGSSSTGMIVAAWGNHGDYIARARQVGQVISSVGRGLHCLGTTKSGHPRHPSRLGYSTLLEPWMGWAT